MMEQLKLNDGVTFLDVLIGIVALLGFASMMVTTTNFMAKNQQQVREETQFNQVVHNTINETYTLMNWGGLTDESVVIDDGLVEVNYNYLGIRSEYSTETLNISFSLEDRVEAHQLERSVLYDN